MRTGQEYIRAGGHLPVLPSQRLRVPSPADPFDVYRALRIINPSPFMFYSEPGVHADRVEPGILCRVEGQGNQPPAAGTRRRGATPEEDKRSRRNCWPTPRARRASHAVDLHRNDVGEWRPSGRSSWTT